MDGHIVLDRELANANHFPAVDVLKSVSRLDRAVCSKEEIAIISKSRDLLAVYKQNEDLINVGAYVKNSNPKIDQAIDKYEPLTSFLRQSYDQLHSRTQSFELLKSLL